MKYAELKKRLQAAEDILNDTKTSFEKFEALKHLLGGLSPKTDQLLNACSKELTKLEKLHKGEVIELTAHHLPEHTDEQKKKKKVFLLFIGYWKDLHKEVKRVETEMKKSHTHGDSVSAKATGMGRIIALAKGPLGIITAVAVVLVVLKTSAVKVLVVNTGCKPIEFFTSPLPIPGLVLPKEPIETGGQEYITIPPITLDVDATVPDILVVKVLGISRSFDLPGVTIVFNDNSLSEKKSNIRLGERKEHKLAVNCR